MAGVPHHSAHGYIQRLLKAGKKIAIGEQMEDPAATKGLVKREIIRVLSPGVQFDLESHEAAWLGVALREVGQPQGTPSPWTLACLDVSTGHSFFSTGMSAAALAEDLVRHPIRQLLRIDGDLPEEARAVLRSDTLVEDLSANTLSFSGAEQFLRAQFRLATLEAFLPSTTAIHALGLLAHYAARTQRLDRLEHLQLPRPLHHQQSLVYGPQTAEHLDLFPTPDHRPNLLHEIQASKTSAGARLLRRWIAEPLTSLTEIKNRQCALEVLGEASGPRQRMQRLLSEVYDLERILGRVHTGLANPRDTRALGLSLCQLPLLLENLNALDTTRASSPSTLLRLQKSIEHAAQVLQALGQRIVSSQRDDAPMLAREGGIFKLGTHPDLDRLLGLAENGSQWLITLETREREVTGIPSLKVKYNRVFGYFIEITQAHLKNVPSHYQRKQTTVGAERFFTEELKTFEDEIVSASAKQKALEQTLFDELLASIRAQTQDICQAAQALAELDVLVGLTHLLDRPGWVFPILDDSLALEIQKGRHPLVDRGEFVPNDLTLKPEDRRTLLITGPNMGGKSTLMRQVALIVILGQIGAPVPAASAQWGVVGSIYTRIGAHDAIAKGQSTFMVEMTELAHLLHHANDRSLVILDEIGRGTSTYDGMSVAWATLEWICNRVGSRTLFATHYHELTRLAEKLPALKNAHMAVDSRRDLESHSELRFLYLLQEGPTNESFGIHVAKLAGLPQPVISRAWEVLESLENEKPAADSLRGTGPSATSGTGPSKKALVPQPASDSQLSFFAPSPPRVEVRTEIRKEFLPHPALDALRAARLEEMTPLQALNLLAELQRQSKSP
jgi:DNA mismatch repair protein MutS